MSKEQAICALKESTAVQYTTVNIFQNILLDFS